MLFKDVTNDTDSVSLVLEVVGAVSQSGLVHTARNEGSSRQGIATHCEFQYISALRIRSVIR